MSEYTDLQDMIDVLTIAIAREESEERFFRRSCKASTHKIACEMFEEIAGEYANHSQTLESRRQMLMEALEDLRKKE
jgi:rubrerythrin